jgi:NADP-dependent 3-hydroxy acid dehydrogenase YdfG
MPTNSLVGMSQELNGRTVAITGASSGIGEATALACAEAGAAVALGARRMDRIEELAKRIEADGGRAVAIETDVADEAQANAFVTGTQDALGGLDVLVNNAGVMLLGPIENAPTEEWRRMIDVNLLGLLYCTHAAVPIMREQGSGHIVNVSSVAGRVARAGSGVYNLTKHGVGAFSEALRQEVYGAGVRVTIIEPGAVATELGGHNRPEVQEEMQKRFADVEMMQASDIANAILYALVQPQRVSINEVLVRPTTQGG